MASKPEAGTAGGRLSLAKSSPSGSSNSLIVNTCVASVPSIHSALQFTTVDMLDHDPRFSESSKNTAGKILQDSGHRWSYHHTSAGLCYLLLLKCHPSPLRSASGAEMTLLRLQGAADLFQGLHEGDQAEAHAYLQREGSHHGGYPGRGSDQGEAGHERNLWPVIPEPEQLTIAEYMDVVSVCRTDSGG